jgi:hypothetical protein
MMRQIPTHPTAPKVVIPAKAGTASGRADPLGSALAHKVPAFAGMTSIAAGEAAR